MIQLGVHARDRLSNFTGYVYCRCEMYNGNVQYGLQPQVSNDKPYEHPSGKTFDEQQLEVTTAPSILSPMEEPKCPFQIGDKVVDEVSKLEGTVVERIMFLNGCMYLNVESSKFADNGKLLSVFVPYQRVHPVKVTAVHVSENAEKTTGRRPGGPTRQAPTQR